jgi:hypothetical protein
MSVYRIAAAALVCAGLFATSASAGPPVAAPPSMKALAKPYAPPAAPLAPSVVYGYAALTDPATGHHYVQHDNGVGYGFLPVVQFKRLIDGAPQTLIICNSSCGVGVDDRGAIVPDPASSMISAFGYAVVFQVDETLTQRDGGYTRDPGHGTYHGLPILAVVRYNPSVVSYDRMVPQWRVFDNYRNTHQDMIMTARGKPFDGIPNP